MLRCVAGCESVGRRFMRIYVPFASAELNEEKKYVEVTFGFQNEKLVRNYVQIIHLLEFITINIFTMGII